MHPPRLFAAMAACAFCCACAAESPAPTLLATAGPQRARAAVAARPRQPLKRPLRIAAPLNRPSPWAARLAAHDPTARLIDALALGSFVDTHAAREPATGMLRAESIDPPSTAWSPFVDEDGLAADPFARGSWRLPADAAADSVVRSVVTSIDPADALRSAPLMGLIAAPW